MKLIVGLGNPSGIRRIEQFANAHHTHLALWPTGAVVIHNQVFCPVADIQHQMVWFVISKRFLVDQQVAVPMPALVPAVVDAPVAELVIEGVNVREGMSRALGNRDFYLHMLGRFRDSQSDVAARIRQALETDRVQAERIAHSIKGAAALLGAGGVQRISGEVEAAIRAGAQEEALAALIHQLDGAMRALCTAIDGVLPTAPPAQPPSTREAAGDGAAAR